MHGATTSQKLANTWRQWPRRVRTTIVVLLAATLAAGAYIYHSSAHTHYVPLFDDCEVSPADAQRMRVAFAQSKLSDAQFTTGGVKVPHHRWAAYVQALVDHDAIPDKLKPHVLQPPNVNLFATRRQQDQLELHQRKQNLRELIVRLPFVETAIVDLDVLEQVSGVQPRQYSCVISVQPRSGQVLHDDEVESIRRIVLGAVGGAAPNRIYITDLSCGITHDPTWSAPSSVPAESVRWRQLQAVQDLKDRIRSQLMDLGPVEIQVRLVPKPSKRVQLKSSMPNAQTQIATNHDRPQEPLATSPLPAAGSNSQASIRTVPSHDHVVVQSASAKAHAPSEQFAISLAVPEATLQSFWLSATHHPTRAAVPWTDDEARLAFDRLRLEMVQRIRQILPVDEDEAEPAIDLMLIEDHSLRQHATTSWSDWLQTAGLRPEGGWAVFIACLAILVLVSAVAARRPRRPLSAQGPSDSAEPPANPRLAELRQQIDQLIQNDPDTAARVIQQWLRRTN